MGVLVMGAGSVIINVITQDLTQMGGLWQRRPVTGLSVLVGIWGIVALPPLGGFWAMLKLISGLWETHQGLLVGLVLAVNWIAAFALARMFGLMFAGQPNQMTIRAPEPLWLMVVPMALTAGLTLHMPLILEAVHLLPDWAGLNIDLALALTGASAAGFGIGALLYMGRLVENPAGIVPSSIRNLLAFDFYTPRIYKGSVVLGVALLSRLTDWLDRYLVDGFVNLVGLASLVSGETLKYSNTGRFQFYVFTISIGVALISVVMSWRYLPSLLTAPFGLF